ncbi:MAG: metallophosphoesterase [archaeon]
MVKLFIVGDFHGKISDKLIEKIKKEKPDFILSPGDFCGNEKIGKLFFKYFYGKSEDEVPDKILKESERLENLSFSTGVNVIKKLKQLKIPVFAIHGNWDPTPYPFDLGGSVKETKKESFRRLTDKRFKLIDFSLIEEKDFILIGGGSSTSPGIPSFKSFKEELRESDSYRESGKIFLRFLKVRREYLRRKIVYKRLFAKAKRIANGRKIIFLTHNCPYKTKLDIIKSKHAPKTSRGQHYGSYLERKIIEQFQPEIVLCGHIHECAGTDKIKKSVIYNIGSSLDGKFKILKI